MFRAGGKAQDSPACLEQQKRGSRKDAKEAKRIVIEQNAYHQIFRIIICFSYFAILRLRGKPALISFPNDGN